MKVLALNYILVLVLDRVKMGVAMAAAAWHLQRYMKVISDALLVFPECLCQRRV